MILRILKFEILGIFFISLLGSFLHFTFALTNKLWLAGIFSAVNESTWEHLKLAVVPAIFWMILENKIFKLKTNNFLLAKTVSIYLMPILIIVLFYSYTAILGYNLLVFDISTFIIAVIMGQIVSYKIMMRQEFSARLNFVWALLLAALFSAFVVFTFYAPHNFLFQDPISGLYGIIK